VAEIPVPIRLHQSGRCYCTAQALEATLGHALRQAVQMYLGGPLTIRARRTGFPDGDDVFVVDWRAEEKDAQNEG